MEHRSPIIPIILGILLIVIVLGTIGLQILNTPETEKNGDSKLVEQPVATTTPQDDETISWPTHTDLVLGYSIQYEPGMIVEKNAVYPIAPQSKTKATVIHFATSTLASTTISAANVSITKTKTGCALWADASQKVAVLSTKTLGRTLFEYRELRDAGAGNLYTVQEYSTASNKECLRISLYVHMTNPGVLAAEEDERILIEANTTAMNTRLESVFDTMMNSFQFITEE